MIFAATFMPTEFFWLPPVALFVLFITSWSWKWHFHFLALRLSNPLLALVIFASYAVISSIWGSAPMHSLGKAFLLCALAGCGYLLVQNNKNLKMKDFHRGGRIAMLFFIFGVAGYLLLVFESSTFFCALCPIAFSYNLWSSWMISLFCIAFWLLVLFGHETEKTTTSTQ